MGAYSFFITIFTPTYNRAERLHELYHSLCRQTDKDFEWLIVDDGSEDNTYEVIQGFIKEGIINIRYFRQNNRGKHIAINHGINKAMGRLFWCVDSDDYIADDAIEWIRVQVAGVLENPEYVGICGEKVYFDGHPVERRPKEEIIDSNALDIMYKYHVSGDMAEVFKTDILSKFPFPDTADDEKFCAESLVWNRIAQQFKIRYFFNKGIYYCEYLEDGLSARSVRLRHSSPQNTMTLYSELSHYRIPFLYKFKANVNFWRFFKLKHFNLITKNKMFGIRSFVALPIGLVMKIKDSIKI